MAMASFGSRRDVSENRANQGRSKLTGMICIARIVLIVMAYCCTIVQGKPFVPSRSSGNQPKTWDFDDNVVSWLRSKRYFFWCEEANYKGLTLLIRTMVPKFSRHFSFSKQI